jgi:hypothetical protein
MTSGRFLRSSKKWNIYCLDSNISSPLKSAKSKSPVKVHQENLKSLTFGNMMLLREKKPFEKMDTEYEAERLVKLKLASYNAFDPLSKLKRKDINVISNEDLHKEVINEEDESVIHKSGRPDSVSVTEVSQTKVEPEK